ncbi:MAG: outer membrane beta-barrel protein [Polyangiales bacterium]
MALGLCSVASAQTAAPYPGSVTPGAVPPPPTPEPLPPPAQVTQPTTPPVVGPSPVAPVVAEPVTTEPPPAPVAEEAPAAAEEEEAPWYSNFSLGGFVDAYGAIRSDSNRKRPSPPPGTTILGQYAHEGYVTGEGFGLAFAGIDAAYSGDKFGATISLRFGPGVNRFYFGDNGALGIDNITAAYATYKPTENITFDLGQFGTLYGAEVLESWRNVNYSRGALYYAMQPFWHTGLRANFKLHDAFALNAMVVNGVNNAFETNKSPSLGLQAVVTANENFTLAAGYLGALNPRDTDELFQNFFDVVATVTAGGFKLVGNFDFNSYKLKGEDRENWWGVSVAPAYAFNDYFGIGLRYEYLSDSQNKLFAMTPKGAVAEAAPTDDDPDATALPTVGGTTSLNTFTATLDIKPVPGSAALVIRPEFRYEVASDNYFNKSGGSLTDGFWTAHLGVVVTSLP